MITFHKQIFMNTHKIKFLGEKLSTLKMLFLNCCIKNLIIDLIGKKWNQSEETGMVKNHFYHFSIHLHSILNLQLAKLAFCFTKFSLIGQQTEEKK